MKTKRVLLINTNTEKTPYPVPPIGLGLIAESLKSRYSVKVFDGTFSGGTGLETEIADFKPDFVGLSIRNHDNLSMRNPERYVAKVIGEFLDPVKRSTRAPVILGGAGFSVMPESLMEETGADFGVVGEGEDAFHALLGALERKRDPSGIPGVVSAGNPRPWEAPCPPPRAMLGPSRIHEWIDVTPYRARGSYPMQTRRGCMRRCVYCSYPLIEGADPRFRTADSVAGEIAAVRSALGGMTIEFVDSVFNEPDGRVEEICAEILRRGLSGAMRTMGVNPRGATGGMFRAMKDAGFVQIDMTPDSASPAMLESLGKGFSIRDLEAAAAGVLEATLPVMWFFLFGGPGETDSTFRETFDFIDRHVGPEDMVHVSAGLRIYPGTRLREIAVQEGVIGASDMLSAPVFYVSKGVGGPGRLMDMILEACSSRPNCVPAWETAASPEMLKEAAGIRQKEGLSEPMFRTLLRLRRAKCGHEPGGMRRFS